MTSGRLSASAKKLSRGTEQAILFYLGSTVRYRPHRFDEITVRPYGPSSTNSSQRSWNSYSICSHQIRGLPEGSGAASDRLKDRNTARIR